MIEENMARSCADLLDDTRSYAENLDGTGKRG
jgi:hypothetical protein